MESQISFELKRDLGKSSTERRYRGCKQLIVLCNLKVHVDSSRIGFEQRLRFGDDFFSVFANQMIHTIATENIVFQ